MPTSDGIACELKKYGITINQIKLLNCALQPTPDHMSKQKNHPSSTEFKRLEWIGDAALEWAIRRNLIIQYPNASMGDLQKATIALVSNGVLAQLGASRLNLRGYIQLNDKQRYLCNKMRGKQTNVFARTLEAIIGVIALDKGMPAVEHFVERVFGPVVRNVMCQPYEHPVEKLSRLVEHRFKCKPVFKVIKTKTDPMAGKKIVSTIVVGCYAGNQLLTKASGHSEKKARIEAAKLALMKIFKDRARDIFAGTG